MIQINPSLKPTHSTLHPAVVTRQTSASAADESAMGIVRVVLGRWKYFAACALVSCVAGYVLAGRLASITWTHEAKLLYSRPAAIASYTPPDTDSLAKLYKSQELLERLSAEFGNAFPPEAMNRLLRVEPPYGSSILLVSLSWSDPMQGAAILDKSVELFQQQVARRRDTALEQVAQALEISLSRSKEELAQLNQGDGSQTESASALDVGLEAATLRTGIASLENDLAAARSELSSTEALYRNVGNPNHASLPQLIDSATAEAREKISKLETLVASRRAELRNLGRSSKRSLDTEHKLEALTSERQRLHDEMSVVQHLRTEHASGFSVVQPATETLESPTSNKKKIFAGLAMLFMLLLSGPMLVLELYRGRHAPIVRWARQLDLPVLARVPRRPGIDQAEDFRTSADYEIVRLLALRVQQSISAPGSIVAFCGLSQMPMRETLLVDLARCFSERGENVLMLRTDVVDDRSDVRETFDRFITASTRTSAYRRLRRPAHEAAAAEPQAGNVATIERDEPCPATNSSADFNEMIDLVRASALPGVNELRLGVASSVREAWGTQSMTDLLLELRSRYTLILISGPTTARSVDLQMLASRVDGVVLVNTPGVRNVERASNEVVRELAELHAPLLGLIV
jgi:uncharacterized protein involved in exopolysaccharide biosynthesis